MTKTRYTLDVAAEYDAFLEEFGDDLSDAQLGELEDFRDPEDATDLPDGNEVDPREDPATARRILVASRMGEGATAAP